MDAEKPPFRFVLGNYGTTTFARKLASVEAELNAWKEKGLPTDFSPGS
jgi:hypothetical protein